MGAPKFSPFLIIAFLALLLNFPFTKTCFVLFVWLPNKKNNLNRIPRLFQLVFELGFLFKRRIFRLAVERVSLSSRIKANENWEKLHLLVEDELESRSRTCCRPFEVRRHFASLQLVF